MSAAPRPGDLREADLSVESIPDGMGGEIEGVVLRVWVVGEEEGDQELAVSVQIPKARRAWTGALRDVMDTVYAILELER